jgi:hypothetical protein
MTGQANGPGLYIYTHAVLLFLRGALWCDVEFPVHWRGPSASRPLWPSVPSKGRPSCMLQVTVGKLQRPRGVRPPGSGHNSLARDAL